MVGKRTLSDNIFNIANYTILTLLFIVCIFPFYYIFIYSISGPSIAQKGISILPSDFTLINYIKIFKLDGLLNATFISICRAVLGSTITIFASFFFGYVVTKNKLPFRKLIYRFLIITMYFNAGLIPWYLVMKLYHLNDNFLLYIIPSAVSAFYVILMKTYIEQLPPALEESAKLDGAGYLTIILRIVFPLSMPIVATILVFASVSQWNSWFDNYILVQKSNLKTLQLCLYDFLQQASVVAMTDEHAASLRAKVTSPRTIKMTITMVATLPILFVYPFMQRYFIKGIMLGAVKG